MTKIIKSLVIICILLFTKSDNVKPNINHQNAFRFCGVDKESFEPIILKPIDENDKRTLSTDEFVDFHIYLDTKYMKHQASQNANLQTKLNDIIEGYGESCKNFRKINESYILGQKIFYF